MADGLGDFSHFVDIVEALQSNPRFSKVEFIPIILFDSDGKPANKARVIDELISMGYPNAIFGDIYDHREFIANETVQQQIQSFDQAIVISCDLDELLNIYAPYFKLDIPIKLIAEHEGMLYVPVNTPKHAQITEAPLGLASGNSGIKIKPTAHMEPEAAWQIIVEAHPEFSKQLLESTHSDNFEMLQNNHIIIPAYFNNNADFKHQDIVIYHSGSDFSKFAHPFYLSKVQKQLNTTSIQSIQIFTPEENTEITVPCNPDGSQTIRIYHGHYLNNTAYDALYHLSSMAGVSGDNTFERCVSMHVLPSYWSTNPFTKTATLRALSDITQNKDLEISEHARDSFKLFFSPDYYYSFKNSLEPALGTPPDYIHHQEDVDVSLMIKEWPIVCDYLKAHYNFYDKLEAIALADLPEIEQTFKARFNEANEEGAAEASSSPKNKS
ncbi:MAG: hypothetical protein QNK11_08650 [Legionella sp.]|nr:hypothetical protein [Legionella sp.]